MTNERVEVITSVERRRRWSFAEKRQLVAATLEPGASFTPVQIAGEAPSTAGLVGLGTIEIEFAAGARMRISGAVDAATLTAVVAALTRGRPR